MSKVKEFLDLYVNKGTKTGYKSAIISFVECIYGQKRKGNRITKKENEYFIKLADNYFTEERNHYDDLLKFAVSLNNNPPKTARMYFSTIKEFLAHNEIEFSQRKLKVIRLKLPKGNARTVENDMDNTVIRKIIEHMDVKGKALVLTLASSGMRIGEALQITLDDINFDTNPISITLRGEYTKNGSQRFTFINEEAKTTLLEWLKVREKYIKAALNKNKGFVNRGIGSAKDKDDNRIFPFSRGVVNQLWTTALTNANLLDIDEGTSRKKLRIHQLRKFFRSQLALGCPVEIVEALMGHEGYLTTVYRVYTKNQMGEYYLKGERFLSISIPKGMVHGSDFEERLKANSMSLENMVLQNKELREQLEEHKKQMKSMENDSQMFQYIAQCIINKKQPENLVFDPTNNKLVFKG